MNTANLQLEGLYLAIAAINHLLVRKGIVDRDEITLALGNAEKLVLGEQRNQDISAANREAVAFPIRLLQLALESSDDEGTIRFSELARLVGETKT